jgi:hypothetical protein
VCVCVSASVCAFGVCVRLCASLCVCTFGVCVCVVCTFFVWCVCVCVCVVCVLLCVCMCLYGFVCVRFCVRNVFLIYPINNILYYRVIEHVPVFLYYATIYCADYIYSIARDFCRIHF